MDLPKQLSINGVFFHAAPIRVATSPDHPGRPIEQGQKSSGNNEIVEITPEVESQPQTKDVQTIKQNGATGANPATDSNLNAQSLLTNDRFTNNADLKEVINGKKTLGVGVKGDAVKLIQAAFIDMGFAPMGSDDKKFGGQTEGFVKNFQVSADLPVTGKLDAKTLAALDKLAPLNGQKAWDADYAHRAAPVVVAPDRRGLLVASTLTSTGDGDKPAALPPKARYARIVVNKAEHRVFFYDPKGQIQKIYPVGIGTKETPTLSGIKYVAGKMADPTARSQELWDTPFAFGKRLLDLQWYKSNPYNGDGYGQELHGTYVRESAGKDVSHGCMRLMNEDIEEVYQQSKVGDLVVIQDQ